LPLPYLYGLFYFKKKEFNMKKIIEIEKDLDFLDNLDKDLDFNINESVLSDLDNFSLDVEIY